MTDDRPSTLELLDQSEIWTDAGGNRLRIADMELRHARNVIRILESNAERLHFSEGMSFLRGPGPSGDMACDAFDSMMDEFGTMDALVWIRSTDLVQALYQHIGEPVPGHPDEPPEVLCRCGHPESSHDATYNDPQCRECPEDGERTWRHAFTPDDGPPDWMAEDLPEEKPEFGRPASRYGTDQVGGVHVVVQRSAWCTERILRYSHPQAARDAADYLNTLTRWEIT